MHLQEVVDVSAGKLKAVFAGYLKGKIRFLHDVDWKTSPPIVLHQASLNDSFYQKTNHWSMPECDYVNLKVSITPRRAQISSALRILI